MKAGHVRLCAPYISGSKQSHTILTESNQFCLIDGQTQSLAAILLIVEIWSEESTFLCMRAAQFTSILILFTTYK